MSAECSSLDDRLRAYNRTATPAPQKQKTSAHFEMRSTEFTAHPLSGENFELPVSVAHDFRNNTDRQNLLFFDLESTGLGSGEQIYPFLIGFARATGAGAALTTLFAETPAGEEEILRGFIDAAEATTLVSFNGKSFDLPLIIRRAGKYNLKHNLTSRPHIDLFHLIRRIYPEKPARLKDAETRLLGFTRAGDLGGAEVAQAYFELLRLGARDLKEKILLHNQWDVLTLLSLMQRVAAAFEAARLGSVPWAYKIHRDKSADKAQQKALLTGNTEQNLDARDLYTLGKIFRSEENTRRAVRHFLASYRGGYALAIVDAVRALLRLKKSKAAISVARYGMAREDERIQKHLIRYL